MIIKKRPRLEYFDSLRGLAILIVVYFHILSYNAESHSLINYYIVRWMMPLFFFISGFFAFLTCGKKELIEKRIKNHISKQLYPTIVVWMIFILFSWSIGTGNLTEYVKHGIYDSMKLGYWFTISLVEADFFYVLLAFGLLKFRITIKHQSLVFLVSAVVAEIIQQNFLQDLNLGMYGRQIYNMLCIGQTIPMMSFFFLGVFCSINQEKIFQILGHYVTVIISVSLFFLTSSITSPNFESGQQQLYLLSRITGLVSIISVFICFKKYFFVNAPIGHYLNRLGRNTLPIYLFHFFIIALIPFCLPNFEKIKDFLEQHWWMELPIVMFTSIVITEVCLVVNLLIKKHPLCNRLIFNSI